LALTGGERGGKNDEEGRKSCSVRRKYGSIEIERSFHKKIGFSYSKKERKTLAHYLLI